ncbi:MAG: hypothetical protein RSD49_08070 [Hafnia sp.]
MLIKTANQLSLGDVFKRIGCDEREWAVVIGFSKRKHVKAKKLAEFYNGLEVVVQPRASIRYEVKEASDA